MNMKMTAYQNLWDTTEGWLRRKFIALNDYIKQAEMSQINNLRSKPKKKKQKNKSKINQSNQNKVNNKDKEQKSIKLKT